MFTIKHCRVMGWVLLIVGLMMVGCEEQTRSTSPWDTWKTSIGAGDEARRPDTNRSAPGESFVAPLDSNAAPFDLRRVVAEYGATLEVGYYDEGYDGNFRQAAEQKTLELRGAGQQAYFYHGPHKSSVTIGLFDRRADTKLGPDGQTYYSTDVVDLRKQYPYLEHNGYPIKIKRANGKETIKFTHLVNIPQAPTTSPTTNGWQMRTGSPR